MHTDDRDSEFRRRLWSDPSATSGTDRATATYDSAVLLKERLFSHVRYNAELSQRGLDDLSLADVVPEEVQKLDSVEHIADLRRVGQAVAREVTPRHFAGFLGTRT